MAFLKKQQVAWISVASNTILTVGKVFAGVMTGSVSILSEAAHSAIDLLAAGMATFSVHVADRPPDEDHHYGHEKVENVSGVLEGILIFGAAVWIIVEASNKLLHRSQLAHLGPGAVVMAVSAIINMAVATVLQRTAAETRSVALEADAAHLFADVYTSVGVFLGLAGITVARYFFNKDIAYLDPVIAIGVAVFIMRTGSKITWKSFLPLIDFAGTPDEETGIKEAINQFRGEGVDFHKLRTRRAGATLHVDLHMGVRPGITLERGHEISHQLKARIVDKIPGASVLIHVEPSSRIEVLPPTDERISRIREELLKDDRVADVWGLKAMRYNGELRVETDLSVDPKVTLAESRSLSDGLKRRLSSRFTDLKDLVLEFHPGDGWQNAIHDDDKQKISELVGEHESSSGKIHSLQVSSCGAMHRVRINLGLPPSLPLSVAHSIARHLEEDIKALFHEGGEVDLHVEPCDEKCEACAASCPKKSFNKQALSSSERGTA